MSEIKNIEEYKNIQIDNNIIYLQYKNEKINKELLEDNSYIFDNIYISVMLLIFEFRKKGILSLALSLLFFETIKRERDVEFSKRRKREDPSIYIYTECRLGQKNPIYFFVAFFSKFENRCLKKKEQREPLCAVCCCNYLHNYIYEGSRTTQLYIYTLLL